LADISSDNQLPMTAVLQKAPIDQPDGDYVGESDMVLDTTTL